MWLGKLTVLDITPVGLLGRKTSTQTNKIWDNFHEISKTVFQEKIRKILVFQNVVFLGKKIKNISKCHLFVWKSKKYISKCCLLNLLPIMLGINTRQIACFYSAEVYDPAKVVTEVLKGLCSSEQACEICLFKDEITSTLLSPISHFLDVAVSILSVHNSAGPSCSKLTTSLVNDSLKFAWSDTQICWNFLLKKCE